MPYPALPPELPPVISVAPTEAAQCPSLIESPLPGLAQPTSSAKLGSQVGNENRRSIPETFPPQSSSQPLHSAKQASKAKPNQGVKNSTTKEKPSQAFKEKPGQVSKGKPKPGEQVSAAKANQASVAKSGQSNQEKPAQTVQAAPENLEQAVQQLSSCATLLGKGTATGYLPADKAVAVPSVLPKPAPPAATVATSRPLPWGIRPIALPQRLDETDNQPQPISKPVNSSTSNSALSAGSASLSYEISGVSGRLASLPEKTVMQKLNEAIVFEALAESYQALGTLTADDLKRFARDRSNRNQVSQSTVSPDPAESLPSPSDTLFPQERFPILPPNQSAPADKPASPSDAPAPNGTAPVPVPNNVIEVTADRQEYDERRQIFTAEGNVMMRFRNGLLEADRVQVNLPNRLSVAEGNVALTRGRQVLRGQRFEYNFVQGVGTVEKARGDIFLPSLSTDTAFGTETVPGEQVILSRPLSERITSQQQISNVRSPGGINFSAGAGRDIRRVPGALPAGGKLNRLRFEAERLDFTPEGWVAENIDITNDPFSPPEFVLRADKAVLTRLSPLEDEVVATRGRLVFDQRVSVPILRRRFLLSRAEQEPTLFRFGFDNEDRGGLFLEGILNVISTPKVSFSIYPQILLQRMFLPAEGQISDGPGDPRNYGVRSTLDVRFSDTTTLRARASLTSLDFDEFDDKFRASIRLNQEVLPTPFGPHRVGLEYSYRDRLFNGSLGFQTVQTSLGFIFQSPNILLGKTGLTLNYQTGYQIVSADTDRLNLLPPMPTSNLVQLGRFQATSSISRSFALWTGKPLPATRNEGLNYTPNPIVPQIALATTLRGVFSQYTSGDIQQNLIGTVGISGQFGHFSRPFFDYTSFGVFYSQVVGSGQSPFLFDRTVDNRILALSFFQQIYGPLRAGVQSSINVGTGEEISTDIFLEYSRRTHGIILRYNPVLELGSISFRVSDFNWTGTAEPFQGSGVVPVEGGVERRF